MKINLHCRLDAPGAGAAATVCGAGRQRGTEMSSINGKDFEKSN
jgi:hypothetical protein